MSPIIVPAGGGQTFLDLQNLALGDDFDATKYRTQVKQAINDAIDDIARQANLPLLEDSFTISTAQGTGVYPIPVDDVRLMYAFDAETHEPLREVEREWIDERDDVAGTPFAFAQYGGQVVLYYTPGADSRDIVFRYRKEVNNLVADGDIVSDVLPDSYAYAVVSFARDRLYGLQDDPEMSAFWRGQYERDLIRIKGDVGRRRPRRQIPGQPGHRGVMPSFRRP